MKAHLLKHARTYAIILLLGLTAFRKGFYEDFGPLTQADWIALGWWQKVALLSHSIGVGELAILAYLISASPLQPSATSAPVPPRTNP